MMERTAAETLDNIRDGANALLVIAQQRVTEVKGALERGEFRLAHQAAESLAEKIEHLADAQGTMGRLSGARIVRAQDLAEGMRTADLGEVESVGDCPFCDRPECSNVTITFGNGQAVVSGDTEIVVQEDAPA